MKPLTIYAGSLVPVSERWLHDNDVVIKLCGYGLLDILFATLGDVTPTVLATSTYSLPHQVDKNARIADRTGTGAELSRFLAAAQVIEPEPNEIALAALIEEKAVRQALPLDGGESQLIAVLACRGMRLLVTGDKRAIEALHALGDPDVQERIACFEQLVATLVLRAGSEPVRARVCAEPNLDRTMTSCFACSSEKVDTDSIDQGLASYVGSLRRSSGNLLIFGTDLSAIVA